ncbi:MAG: DUF262 domain-containing protein, partial [Candidatus Bathyarchaeia archaeon]
MPEIKPLDLVRMIENGEIDIPELQREFVWSNQQVRDLAESIYNRYPIGLITLYKVPKDMAERPGTRYWVLDGQQRILSLALIVNGSIKEVGRTRTTWVWFNPRNEDFRWTEPPRELSDEWINLSKVLKMSDEQLVKFTQDRPAEEREKINLLWLRFRDYNILVHEIREDLDLDQLGDIFVRTNFAGTRVRGAEVYSTMLAVAEPGIVKELRNFADSLETTRGWKIDYGVMIRTFMAFLTDGKVKLASRVLEQANKLKESLQKQKGAIPEIMQKTKNGIESSIELLMDPSLLSIASPTSDFLPSQNVLVTIAYYLGKREAISEKDKKGLLAWYVLASEFARYSSAAETRLNEDLSVIQEGGD